MAITTRKVGWVLDADIEACFDRIEHCKLLAVLGRRIADRRLLRLIEHTLVAGVVDEGKLERELVGRDSGCPDFVYPSRSQSTRCPGCAVHGDHHAQGRLGVGCGHRSVLRPDRALQAAGRVGPSHRRPSATASDRAHARGRCGGRGKVGTGVGWQGQWVSRLRLSVPVAVNTMPWMRCSWRSPRARSAGCWMRTSKRASTGSSIASCWPCWAVASPTVGYCV